MRQTVVGLLVLGALAFAAGTAARFLAAGVLLGNEAVVYWRGAIGFLLFAVVLLLLQIRDRMEKSKLR